MRKGQQQIRCSSGVSIAGRTDSRPQVKSVFIPVLSPPIPKPCLSLTRLSVTHSASHGLLQLCPNPNLGVFPLTAYSKGFSETALDVFCLCGFRNGVFVFRRRGAQEAGRRVRCQKR